jgi:hypothetical protein
MALRYRVGADFMIYNRRRVYFEGKRRLLSGKISVDKMESSCADLNRRTIPDDHLLSEKMGQIESAGINRHRVGDKRALHERSSCLSWPRVMCV